VKGVDGGAGAGCHSFDMGVLAEVVLEKDAKVLDRVGPTD